MQCNAHPPAEVPSNVASRCIGSRAERARERERLNQYHHLAISWRTSRDCAPHMHCGATGCCATESIIFDFLPCHINLTLLLVVAGGSSSISAQRWSNGNITTFCERGQLRCQRKAPTLWAARTLVLLWLICIQTYQRERAFSECVYLQLNNLFIQHCAWVAVKYTEKNRRLTQTTPKPHNSSGQRCTRPTNLQQQQHKHTEL